MDDLNHESPYATIVSAIAAALHSAASGCGYGMELGVVKQTLELARGYGDISSTMALRIAKSSKKDPSEVAESIMGKIAKLEFIDHVSKENGFINFHIDRGAFTKLVLLSVIKQKDGYVKSGVGKGRKAIVEYPSVNPVHPWHVGQVRSALLGDSVANIMEACGYTTERIDYIDDLGLQVAEVIWGWMHPGFLKGYMDDQSIKSIDILLGLAHPNLKGSGLSGDVTNRVDYVIGAVYVAVNKYMKEHPIDDQIKDVLKLMEQPGTREAALSRKLAEYYVMAEYETAFAYNMYHDTLIWESDIIREHVLEKALDKLRGSAIVKIAEDEKYKGCLVIDFNKVHDLPEEFKGLKEDVKVLVRSNGTPNYLAKDIAFHMWKFGMMESPFKYATFIEMQPNGKPLYTTTNSGVSMQFGNADRAVNTIDSRQSYEQALVKLALDATGHGDKAEGFKHLSYGMVELESGALAGRKGTWVGYTADDLLREAKEKALSLIGSKFDLNQDEKDSIASDIALSAIRFEFLKLSCEKKLVFSWERALNFEGNSGPYCEYMYARAVRILENSGMSDDALDSAGLSPLDSDIEFELVKKLSVARDVMEKACREYKPNAIIEYVGELALLFGKFYEQRPVLKAPTVEEKVARLTLVGCFATVMGGMLSVCGIKPVKKM